MSKPNTRAIIDANIRQNGRQLITGQVLNAVLNSMVTDYAEQAALDALKEKVDALALGAFYGYFPDSASLLTDVTTPGYAYVGSDNPYEIWNFNGESWSDSGTSIDMNDADEEDITRNADGKLQFKDRSYGDGMGYVILRKDKTFAEQVIEGNTIYEVRYDYEIDTSFTMPANIRLKFDGGAISVDGGGKIASNSVKASEIGMVRDNASFAVKNATLLAFYSNMGMDILIDGSYYFDSVYDSPIELTNDVKWMGGKLIRTRGSGQIYTINTSIKIELNGVEFDGDYEVTENTRSFVFGVDSILFSKGVYVYNCVISKVRLYTHNGADVDQESVVDGDYEVVFDNNKIFDIANAVCRISDCKCNLLKITNNTFNKIHNVIFNAGITNEYQILTFSRLENAIITGNYWDNSDYIIPYTSQTYNCFIVLECYSCIFNNNYIKDFIVLDGPNTCVTYPAYLSTNICEMVNNTFINVVGFNNPTYSDIFKCKMTPLANLYTERKIENNTYILTKECVETYGDVNNPPVKTFANLQESIENIRIANNFIDAYCFFHLGGGSDLKYSKYEFINNKVFCYSISNSNLLRFATDENPAIINIIGNAIIPQVMPSVRCALFYNAIPDNYKINAIENDFRGYSLGFGVTATSIIEKFDGRLSLIKVGEGNVFARHYCAPNENIVFDVPFDDITYANVYNFKHSRFTLKSLKSLNELRFMGTAINYQTNPTTGLLVVSVKSLGHKSTIVLEYKTDAVIVTNGNGETTTISRTVSSSQIYVAMVDKYSHRVARARIMYENGIYLNFSDTTAENIEIAIDWTTGDYVLPNLMEEYVGATLTSVDALSPLAKGIPMMYSGELVFFDGSKARTADGYSVVAKKGTTAQRPANLDNANDVGYVYFDSTLGKPIYWTGTKWVDATGADA